ncbi:MAG: bifunctional phosphoribosylaminoimidazolecarboxamide formyltransferase/IMP cyclohydrolase PurH [Rickettsiales bacterium]|nr:bifunctional phosphoribosylaminoimidazolecarboxamide formyltransferase/IMP cyclohydrolase PurH [Rickettsiales bacterium]
MKEYALISVQNKKNLSIICNTFKKNKINIISTGGSYKTIKKLGFKAIKVSEITKFEEVLDGRVKTLHPKIHAGILFDRKKSNHKKIITKKNIPAINYLVVNLYDFKKTIKNTNDKEKSIENIDIGGHSLIRAAAKNYKYVNVVTDIKDYKKLDYELKLNNGKTSIDFRKKLANKAFRIIGKYDLIISNWFNNKNNLLSKKLKYGENPHQKAYLISKKNKPLLSFIKKIQGKEMSYNNINDTICAISCIKDLNKYAAVFIKHSNPCGAAQNNNIVKAFDNALASDRQSAYGGVVIFNKCINEQLAKKINKIHLDIIIAPSFNKSALNILKNKKVILLILKKTNQKKEVKSIPGGLIEQEIDKTVVKRKNLRCVTKFKSQNKLLDDMIFAYSIAKHVKSNAIVIAKNSQVMGIGAGQMSRIDAIEISMNKMKKNFGKNKSYVLASDGFLPFPDNITKLSKSGCRGIIQPGGSKNDSFIIEKANKYKIPMYFTGIRQFKH